MTNRPNILIIYPDQMRSDAMGCAGNKVVKTPNIDRLAQEGMHFTEAYTSYPVCCPFRASVLTGKYAQGHGMVQNHFPLRGDQRFLGDMMKEAGYQTGYIGKWHLEGGPKPGFVPKDRRFGFDHFIGFNRGHEYLKSVYFDDGGTPHFSKRYEPDYQTDQLIDFIDSAMSKDADKPFFGYVSYGPPHFPNNMPDHWRSMYDPADMDLRAGVPNMELQRQVQERRLTEFCGGETKAAHHSHAAYDTKPAGEPETEAEIRQFMAEYYGMISNIDWNIGRILNHLDKSGIADNTMVIFWSDHGDMLGQHGSFCGIKNQAYRAAMQVPFIIRYPKRVQAGQKTTAMVDVGVDLMATLCDMLEMTLPEEAHSISYLDVLDGTSDTGRDAIYYQLFKQQDGNVGEYTPYAQRGIRTKDWLYVRHKDCRADLYDLQADYLEQNNLVDDPAYSALMDEFDARIDAHMKATNDDWDMCANFPPPDWVTHGEAKEYLENILLPNAVIVD